MCKAWKEIVARYPVRAASKDGSIVDFKGEGGSCGAFKRGLKESEASEAEFFGDLVEGFLR